MKTKCDEAKKVNRLTLTEKFKNGQSLTPNQLNELSEYIKDADSCPENKKFILKYTLEEINTWLFQSGITDKDGCFLSAKHPLFNLFG